MYTERWQRELRNYPFPNEGEPDIIINMEEVYRDKLNAPIFTGVEDVEQLKNLTEY